MGAINHHFATMRGDFFGSISSNRSSKSGYYSHQHHSSSVSNSMTSSEENLLVKTAEYESSELLEQKHERDRWSLLLKHGWWKHHAALKETKRCLHSTTMCLQLQVLLDWEAEWESHSLLGLQSFIIVEHPTTDFMLKEDEQQQQLLLLLSPPPKQKQRKQEHFLCTCRSKFWAQEQWHCAFQVHMNLIRMQQDNGPHKLLWICWEDLWNNCRTHFFLWY